MKESKNFESRKTINYYKIIKRITLKILYGFCQIHFGWYNTRKKSDLTINTDSHLVTLLIPAVLGTDTDSQFLKIKY